MNSSNVFQLGRFYSRKEIAKHLGGGTQNYLPHKGKHVVCGCFRRDLNPEAPSKVLPGNSDDKRRRANKFADQPEAVPVFLKQASTRWEYVGCWRCNPPVEDPKQLAEERKRTGRGEISMILRLEKVSD